MTKNSDLAADQNQLSFDAIVEESGKKIDELKSEIEQLRAAFGINDEQQKIATPEDLDSFMTRSFASLTNAVDQAQDIEGKGQPESQRILDNLVDQQNRFLVDMKMAQMTRMQFVVDGCEKIKGETNLLKIPNLTAEVKKNVVALNQMPSLSDLEQQGAEVKKMVGLYSQTVKFSGVIGDENKMMPKVLSAGIAQASAEMTQPFASVIKIDENDHSYENIRESFAEDFLEDVGEELREAEFVGSLNSLFEHSFEVAQAELDGEITVTDKTDRLLAAAKTAVANIPIPIPGITAGMNALLNVASFVHGAQREARTRNVSAFATSQDENSTKAENLELRKQIVGSISQKVSDLYSPKINGASALDSLSDSGREKFAAALVGQLIGNIGNFQNPSKDELPKVNDEMFRSDAVYRQQLSEKYGVEVDAKKLSQPTYFNDIAGRIETKMFVEFVSDKLIEKTLHGKDALEILDKTRFERDDLTKGSQGKNMTAEGLIRRVGIITSDGGTYLSADRQKDIDANEAKYGYRLATAEEEKLIQDSKGIEGYLPSNIQSAKAAVLNSVKASDFKGEEKPNDLAAAIDNLVSIYQEEKSKNPKITHEEFLKSDKSPIKSGEKSKMTVVGRVRDEDRQRFNDDLVKPLSQLLSIADKGEPSINIERKTQKIHDQQPNHQSASELAKSDKKPEQPAIQESKKFDPFKTISKTFEILREQVEAHTKKFDQHLKTAQQNHQDLGLKIEKAQEELKRKESIKPSFFQKLANSLFGWYQDSMQPDTSKDKENIAKLSEKAQLAESERQKLEGKQSNIHQLDAQIIGATKAPIAKRENITDLSQVASDTKQLMDHVEIDCAVTKAAADEKKLAEQKKLVIGSADLKAGHDFAVAKAGSENKNVTLKEDAVDNAISVLAAVSDQLAIPGASFALAIASGANDQKKRMQAGQMAENAKEGREIVKTIAGKVYDIYSVKVEGVSALDSLTKKGQEKFIENITSRVLKELAKDPSLKSGKFDVETASDLALERVMKSKQSMFSMSTHFEDKDIEQSKKGETLTIEGMVERAGIVFEDGSLMMARSKDINSNKSKYGFRKATPEEEKLLKDGKAPQGYSKVGELTKEEKETNRQFTKALAEKTFERIAPSRDLFEVREPKLSAEARLELRNHEDQIKRSHIADSVAELESTDAISAAKSKVFDSVSFFGSKPKEQPKLTDEQNSADKKISECLDRADQLSQMAAPQHMKHKDADPKKDLISFVEGYHDKVMSGAGKDDLSKFAREEMPFSDNDQLVKMAVGLAQDFSDAKIAKAVANKEASSTAEEIFKAAIQNVAATTVESVLPEFQNHEDSKDSEEEQFAIDHESGEYRADPKAPAGSKNNAKLNIAAKSANAAAKNARKANISQNLNPAAKSNQAAKSSQAAKSNQAANSNPAANKINPATKANPNFAQNQKVVAAAKVTENPKDLSKILPKDVIKEIHNLESKIAKVADLAHSKEVSIPSHVGQVNASRAAAHENKSTGR